MVDHKTEFEAGAWWMVKIVVSGAIFGLVLVFALLAYRNPWLVLAAGCCGFTVGGLVAERFR